MLRTTALALAVACCPSLASAAGNTLPVVLPIAVHIVTVDGQPVVPPNFIAQRIERANAIFAPYGVAFAVTTTRPLPASHTALETRADRDALARAASKGAIDCFVVRSMRDVDDPTQMRRGVHWHAPMPEGAHYVILSSSGGLSVLAHELGHYLGNPAHSEVVGNLMSYDHGGQLPVLDAPQLKRLQRTLRGYLRRRELVPLAAPAG